MVDQPRYDPYEATDAFPDGTVMRTPPEGTLPFGEPALPEAARTGRRDGRPVERIPVPVTEELVRAGRERFEVVCAPCHGSDGHAATPVAAAMELRPPPSLHGADVRALPPGGVFEVVTSGFGLMPSYAADLDPSERWAVVAYLRALQLSRRLVLDSLPDALRTPIREALEGRFPTADLDASGQTGRDAGEGGP